MAYVRRVCVAAMMAGPVPYAISAHATYAAMSTVNVRTERASARRVGMEDIARYVSHISTNLFYIFIFDIMLLLLNDIDFSFVLQSYILLPQDYL